MIEDRTNGYLDEVKASPQAKSIKGRLSLDKMLSYLDTYGRGENKCILTRDFAPLSFSFVMQRKNEDGEYVYWFNGGLIFHGPHDNGGDGSWPTLSVTLEPTHGWLVHT